MGGGEGKGINHVELMIMITDQVILRVHVIGKVRQLMIIDVLLGGITWVQSADNLHASKLLVVSGTVCGCLTGAMNASYEYS